MTNKNLHPSVEDFKAFVQANPKIIKEVRSGNASWQQLYEEWYLLGPEDSRWNSLLNDNDEAKSEKKEETKPISMSSIVNTLKSMDQNQLQGYISNLNQALGTIQGVLTQFSSGRTTTSGKSDKQQKPTGPFSFRQD